MKRKSTQQATAIVARSASARAQFSKKRKNLRSKLPRRKRAHISPILFNFFSSKVPAFSLNSNFDEVSCITTLESVVLPPNAAFQAGNEVCVKPLEKGAVAVVSVSENSCVESCSVVVAAAAAAEAESKLSKLSENGAVASELSAVQNSPSTATVEQRAPAKNSDELIELLVSDLACTEEFSYDDYEVSSASDDLQSEIFSGDVCSTFEDFTDEYSPSFWLNSGSQFSEKSFDDSSPSPVFSLFKEFHQQFLKLSSDLHGDYEVSSLLDDEYSDELVYWRFESDEDEESYRML